MDNNNKTSNKNFGIVFFIVFFIIAIYPSISGKEIYIWSLFISFIFLFLGLMNSFLLTPLNALWFRFGLTLGKFVAPIIMGIVYFAVVFPTSIFLKIFKKNYLNIGYEKNKKSYWNMVKKNINSMKDQF